MPAHPAPFERAISSRIQECRLIKEKQTGYANVGKLCRGWVFHAGSWQADAALVIDEQIETLEELVDDHTTALKILRKTRRNINLDSIRKASQSLQGYLNAALIQRFHLYMICAGGCTAAERSRAAAMIAASDMDVSGPDRFWITSTMVGVMTSTQASMDEYYNVGSRRLHDLIESMRQVAAATARQEIDSADDDEHADDAEGDWAAMMREIEEDRVGIKREPETISEKIRARKPKADGVIVFPEFELPSPSSSDRMKTRREFHRLAGKRLPFVPTGDVAAHMRALGGELPHLIPVLDRLLRDTAASPHARFQPTVLVGPAGCGKTTLAMRLAEVMELPFTVFDAGSTADGTFAGTAAHWSTSGPALPTRACFVSGKANPLIVVDELEKAATSSQNGSLHNALLGLLEPGNARRYRDPSLELPVDLSHVSYILTANSLEGVPGPLRDRCRVIRVPDPEPQHIGTLVRTIVRDIAKRRGIDPNWIPPLAQDEVEVVRDAWGGGSMRRLRRAVETLIDGRTQHMGRA